MGKAIDLYLVYEFIRRLATPFDKTKAFEAGLIDANGKRLKKASSREEKNALTYFDRLIFNLKRILQRVGAGGKISTYAAALLLLRENTEELSELSEEQLEYILNDQIIYMQESKMTFQDLIKEEIANATGAAVAGTGDDGVHWAKQKRSPGRPKTVGRYISGTAYLKRAARTSIKKRKEFLARAAIS